MKQKTACEFLITVTSDAIMKSRFKGINLIHKMQTHLSFQIVSNIFYICPLNSYPKWQLSNEITYLCFEHIPKDLGKPAKLLVPRECWRLHNPEPYVCQGAWDEGHIAAQCLAFSSARLGSWNLWILHKQSVFHFLN